MRKTLALVALGATTAVPLGDAAVFNAPDIAPVEVTTPQNPPARAEQKGNVVEARMPWRDQPGLTVKYDMGEPTVGERMRDKRDRAVAVETTENGFEINWVLNEKPDTNVFCTRFDGWQDYDFFKQRPLWEDAGLDVPTAECTATDCDGAHRPENVVNSYAVYHKELKNHRIGHSNYATGKYMHRYRVQATDAEGNTVWGDSEFQNGEMCDSVPTEWLNEAVYPVTL